MQIHSVPKALCLSDSGTGIQPPKTYILQTEGHTVVCSGVTYKLDIHFNRDMTLTIKDVLLVSNDTGRVKASGKWC